ncbi:hypothetical protein KJ780_01030 [Candidatus Micrarchaeota archaeon]|nr:hypothetical protein [Candidatus Micrarchaeota archaeon]
MKAQSTFEMFVGVIAFLTFMLPLIYMMFSLSQVGLENISFFSAQSTAQRFSDEINKVYLQGDNAKSSFILDLPPNTEELYIANNTINIVLGGYSGNYEVSHPVFANVSDYNTTKKGLFGVKIWCNNTQVIVQ